MDSSLGGEMASATNLLRALCTANSLIDPTVDGQVLQKRLKFLIYELLEDCRSCTSPKERLDSLSFFFFEKKQFTATRQGESHAPPESAHLLSTLLSSRRAKHDVMAALFAILALELDLEVQFLATEPLRYARITSAGLSVIIDLSQNGKALSTQDLIEALQDHDSNVSPGNPPYLSSQQMVTKYLFDLRDCPSCPEETQVLLGLQNELISLCPSQIGLYGERALIFYQLGERALALRDLKRYFSFIDRDSGPLNLVQLMVELEANTLRSTTEPQPL